MFFGLAFAVLLPLDQQLDGDVHVVVIVAIDGVESARCRHRKGQ